MKPLLKNLFLLAALCTGAMQAWGQCPNGWTLETFTFTGGQQTFVVPPGVTQIYAQLFGAQGANGSDLAGGQGGNGGSVSGYLAVTPGEILYLEVGGQNGYNGGAPAGAGNSGNGGGPTDIRQGGNGINNIAGIAGGGGGGGGSGCDGLYAGGDGGPGGNDGGFPGIDGQDSPTGGGGRGGNLAFGGAAGIGCGGFLGAPGDNNGPGGDGQNCCCFGTPRQPGGGGGGGGYQRGGGGGGGSAGTVGCTGNDKGGGGGGSGGSSAFLSLTGGFASVGSSPGDGYIHICYNANALPWGQCPNGWTTQEFTYTGGQQSFVVPANVTQMYVQMMGAQGNNGSSTPSGLGGTGGLGAAVGGYMSVTPGETLFIEVGGQNGYNGGGAGGADNTGNGGGGSDIRMGGSGLGDRIIVAGGGGGGGSVGCLNAAGAAPVGGNGGSGGSYQGTAGQDSPGGGGGGGGFVFAGGTAGIGCGGFLGSPGEVTGAGGGGQSCCCFVGDFSTPGGGGGGGGYFNGGGGGGGSAGNVGCNTNDKGAGGGGAGGSNMIDYMDNPQLANSFQTGDGMVRICYIVCSATITQSNPNPLCGADTELTASHDGQSPYTYTWSSGETTATITPTVTGSYNVTVTDALGCTAQDYKDVTIGEWLFNSSLDAGDNTQLGRLFRDGFPSTCAAPKTCPNILDPGGSRYYDSYTVTNPDPFNPMCVTVGFLNSCYPEVFVVAYATPFNPNDLCQNYLADGGTSDSTGHFEVSIPPGGSIDIVAHVVSPGATCPSYTITVDQPFPTPMITTDPAGVVCGGVPVVVSASLASSYIWNTGETTQSIFATIAGSYSVTATYGNYGCGYTGNVNITEAPAPTVTINGGGFYCGGSSVTLDAVSPTAVLYLWSNGETTPSITVTNMGVFTVTVTNAEGCTVSEISEVVIGDYYFDGSLDVGDNIQVGRITRDGIPSSCAAPKVCPGLFTAVGDRYYDVHTIANPDPFNAVCATVRFTNTCGTNSFVLAYNYPFNPADLCQNYFADAGSSTDFGYFEVEIYAGGFVDLVVHSVNVGVGCASYSLDINIPRPPLTITADPGLTVCEGTPLSLTASPAMSYSWSTGEFGQSIFAPATGTYSVTANYGNLIGCVETASQTVTVSPAPTVTLSGGGSYCSGASVTLDAISPTATAYLWSNGGTTASITVTSMGVFSVTVTNAEGCTASEFTEVLIGDYFFTGNLDVGDNTQVGRLTRDGISSLCAAPKVCPGVFDAFGDRYYDVHSITNPDPFNTVCATIRYGNTCGTSAFVLAYTYPFNPADLCQNYLADAGSSLGFGYFEVEIPGGGSIDLVVHTVEAGDGCASYSLGVDLPHPALTITGAPGLVICGGAPVTLYAESAGTYQWSTGEFTNPITVTSAGTYSITTTYGNLGCSATASVDVIEAPGISVSITGGGNFCGDVASVTLNAVSPTAIEYFWVPTLETTPSIIGVNDDMGHYSVYVTDANGCEAHTSTEVIISDYVFTGSLDVGDNVQTGRLTQDFISPTCAAPKTCPGLLTNVGDRYYDVHTITNPDPFNSACAEVRYTNVCDGEVFMVAYTYPFNPADLCQNHLADGGITFNYDHFSVEVPPGGSVDIVIHMKDPGNTCPSYTINVDLPRPALAITAQPGPVVCEGTPVNLSASPANGYSWNTGEIGQSIVAPTTGTYAVTAFYGNVGCSMTASVDVSIGNVAVSIGGDLNTCPGGTTTLTASGGDSYLWSTGETNASIVASAGTYSVTATDVNGCTGSASATVSESDTTPPSITCPATQALNGVLDVTLPDYSGMAFATDNCGGATVTQTFPAPGTVYNTTQTVNVTLMATDGSGNMSTCIFDVNVTIGGCNFSTAIDPPNAVVCPGNTANLAATNGVSWSWSTGETNQSITVGTGTYMVTVTDGLGCTASATATVTESTPISGSISRLDATCAGNDGLGSFDVTGGTPNYTYLWSNGATDQIATGLAPGTYTATVTDANGCTASASVTILLIPDTTPPSITCPATQTLNGPLDVTLPDYSGMATATDDCGGATVTQTFPAPGTVYNTSQTVNVTLMATDGAGNMSTCIFDVNINIGGCNLTFNGIGDGTCAGESNGVATINVSGGTSPYTYDFGFGGTTNNSLTGLAAGTYSATVTDAQGCTVVASATVPEFTPPTAAASATDASCPNGTDGMVDLTVTGGAGNDSYLWSNGEVTEDINGLAPGTYMVTVTDANGCTATASATVGATPDVTAPSITCPANQTLNGVNSATLPDYSGMATATDNCGNATVTQTFPAPGTIYNTSQTVNVTLMATDGAGNMSTCIFDVVIAIGGNCPPTPGVIYVDDSAAGANNGSSWTDAYTTLQAALAAAVGGNQIWVAEGTYKPGVSRTANFTMKANVSLYGGFPNAGGCTIQDRDWVLYPTNLSGDIGVIGDGSDNSSRVVQCKNIGTNVRVDGFIIRDALSNSSGGGIGITGDGGTSSPYFVHCVVRENYAPGKGAGCYIYALNGGTADPRFRDCQFIGNISTASDGAALATLSLSGGNINASLDVCSFENNNADLKGGGIANSSNAVGTTTMMSIDSSTFINNTAGTNGGGVWNYARSGGDCQVIITGSYFSGNSAQNGSAVYVHALNSGTTINTDIQNCTFANNTSTGYGAVCNYSQTSGFADLDIDDCSFIGNTSGNGGGNSNVSVSGGTSVLHTQRSWFEGNTGQGGAVMTHSTGANSQSYTNLGNCILRGNSSPSLGGAASCSATTSGQSFMQLAHCTIYGNTAGTYGAAVNNNAAASAIFSTVNVVSSIAWNNVCLLPAGRDFRTTGVPASTYSQYSDLFLPNCSGNNNGTGLFDCTNNTISADPLFVDAANGDFHLTAGSPVIDMGTDAGYLEDYDGNVRPVGNDYDMGAYEYQGPRPLARMAHINNVALFPNPTTGAFTLQFELPATGTVTVSDFTGRTLSTQIIDNASSVLFDLGKFASGVYTVRFVGNEDIIVRTVVVHKP